MMLLRNGSNNEEESTEGSDGPPTPKRARIDEDGLIAEAILAYAVSVDDDPNVPTTYDEAVAGDDAVKWREALTRSYIPMSRIKRGRRSHKKISVARLDHDGSLPRSVIRMALSFDTEARLVAKGFKQKYGVDFFET